MLNDVEKFIFPGGNVVTSLVLCGCPVLLLNFSTLLALEWSSVVPSGVSAYTMLVSEFSTMLVSEFRKMLASEF